MAFQDPHKKPGLSVIIGIGKPSPKKGGMPPPPGRGQAPGQSAPGGEPDGDEPTAGATPPPAGQKVDPSEAGVFETANNCAACKNFEPDTESCKVVDGHFTGEAKGCIAFFTPSAPPGGGSLPGSMLPAGTEGLGSASAGEQDSTAV